MPSTSRTLEQQSSETLNRAQKIASSAMDDAEKAVDSCREQTADALRGAAKAIGGEADRLPKPLNEYADSLKDGLNSSARYIRRHDAGEMASDAADLVTNPPVSTVLLVGAALVGGGFLVSGLLRDQKRESPLSAFMEGLGPKATETVKLFRDALIALMIAKAVEAAEEAMPGFKSHFQKLASE
jgi:hypothetical protein